MQKLVYFTLGLLLGGGLGATTAYILTRKHYEAIADSEIASMREHYAQKERERNAFVTGTTLIEEENEPIEPYEPQSYSKFPSEDAKPDLEELARQKGYINYAHQYNPEEESPSEDSGEGENLANPSEPYIIDDEAYVTECIEYEKREWRYYLEDDTLCNEEDEVLEPRYTVTERAIEKLKKLGAGELVYVRNDALRIDYEVQCMGTSYDEQVLGKYPEEE